MKEFRNFTVVHDSDWKVLAWRSRPVTDVSQYLATSFSVWDTSIEYLGQGPVSRSWV